MTGYAFTSWIWPPLISAALIAAVGVYVWRRRVTPGALPLALLSFLVSTWCVTDAAELAATDSSIKQAWFAFRDFLALPGVILGVWFAFAYAGLQRFLTRPVVAVLVGSILVHIPFYFVSGLLWSRVWLDTRIHGDLGPVGVAFNIWGYGLYLLSSTILLLLFVRSPAHRVPVVVILLGQVALRIAYPLGILNVVSFTHIPPILVAFDFATLMYAIALFRFRIFEVVPVARAAMIERMPDAVIALDSRGRIAELNPAAERLLGASRRRALGQSLASGFSSVAGLAGLVRAEPAGDYEIALGADGGGHFQVRADPLADWQGRPIGRLLTLHDITALRAAEERALEHERTAAGAREREHMARELHDSLGQVLGFLSFQADAARKLLEDGRVREVDSQLVRLADVAREAHGDVRGFIDELHTAATPQVPFTAALRRYLDAFARNFGIGAELAVDDTIGDDALAADEQAQLFRIVQEAMSNARRHGHARRIRVAVGREDSRVRLMVEDDGSGFDVVAASDPSDGRHGLRFMRERAEQLDADLIIESEPARGTRVVVSVPLARSEQASAASRAVPAGREPGPR